MLSAEKKHNRVGEVAAMANGVMFLFAVSFLNIELKALKTQADDSRRHLCLVAICEERDFFNSFLFLFSFVIITARVLTGLCWSCRHLTVVRVRGSYLSLGANGF